jgi:putative DNA primase/helicase
MENYAKFMFNCNELPLPTQHKDAYFRRFIIIPFEQKIPPEEQNPRLAQEIIKEELPGVFNWVLAGLERLLKNRRFTESDKVNAIINKYKTETDTVRHFLNESKLSPGVEREMHLKEMYINYIDFCKDEHSKAHGKTNFSNYLRELGFHIKRINTGMVISLANNKTLIINSSLNSHFTQNFENMMLFKIYMIATV